MSPWTFSTSSPTSIALSLPVMRKSVSTIAQVSNAGIHAIESLHVCGLLREGSVKVCNFISIHLLRNRILEDQQDDKNGNIHPGEY